MMICAHCGEELKPKDDKAELGRFSEDFDNPDWIVRSRAIVHAEPCAIELLEHGWFIA